MKRLVGGAARGWLAAYRGLPAAAWLLSFVAFVHRAGTMVLAFLLLWLTAEHALPADRAGIVLSMHGFGAIAGTLLGGRLADRSGPFPVQKTSLIGTAAGFLALLALDDPVALGVVLAAQGVLAGMLRPANFMAITMVTPSRLQTRAFGLYRLFINLGQTFGMVVGGTLAESDFRLIFLVDAAACVLAAVLLHVLAQPRAVAASDAAATGPETSGAPAAGGPPAPPKPPPPSERPPHRDGVYLVFLGAMLAQGFCFLQVESTLTLHLRDAVGLREGAIGRLIAVNTVLIVLLEMVLVSRLETRRALRVGALGTLLVGGSFGAYLLGTSVTLALVMIVVLTFGEMFAMPFLSGFAAARGGTRFRGRYLGWFTLTFAVSAPLAPIVGTAIYRHGGPDALWAGCVGLGVASAIALLVIDRRVRAAP